MSPAVRRESMKRLMPKENPQWRRVRLAAEGYAGRRELLDHHRREGPRAIFACPAVAAAAVTVLRRDAAATGGLVSALCGMPDHVHLMHRASRPATS